MNIEDHKDDCFSIEPGKLPGNTNGHDSLSASFRTNRTNSIENSLHAPIMDHLLPNSRASATSYDAISFPNKTVSFSVRDVKRADSAPIRQKRTEHKALITVAIIMG